MDTVGEARLALRLSLTSSPSRTRPPPGPGTPETPETPETPSLTSSILDGVTFRVP